MTAEAIPFPDDFGTNVIDLGVQQRYFPARKRSRIGSLIGFFILLGAAVFMFAIGVIGAMDAYQRHGISTVDDKLVGPAIFAFILFLLGLAAGWSAYNNWNKGVGLYERGFVLRSRKGFQVWHWTDVASITSRITRHYTNGIYTGTTHDYTLLNKQNEKLHINDVIQKVEELANAIEQNTYPLLYNPAADAYNSGRMLNFGPVNLDKAGLHIGKKDFPWNTIQQAALRQGMLQITPQGGGLFKGASVPVSSIPNLHILLSIINQVVGLKTG